ncbi:hypothetical protein AMTRI_Chr01g131770 [Amborella trichopoda]
MARAQGIGTMVSSCEAPLKMTTHHAARASGGPWMRNPASNNTPKDIIDDPDESPMTPSSSTHPPRLERRVSGLPHSGRVFTPPWFSHGGIVPEQLRIPFSTQIGGLDYLCADIGTMSYG